MEICRAVLAKPSASPSGRAFELALLRCCLAELKGVKHVSCNVILIIIAFGHASCIVLLCAIVLVGFASRQDVSVWPVALWASLARPTPHTPACCDALRYGLLLGLWLLYSVVLSNRGQTASFPRCVDPSPDSQPAAQTASPPSPAGQYDTRAPPTGTANRLAYWCSTSCCRQTPGTRPGRRATSVLLHSNGRAE